MKKILLMASLLYLCVSLKSQKLLYDLKQVQGSESIVMGFLSGIDACGEYTFSVILPVGGCPRCEGGIPLFFHNVREYFPNDNIALFAVCNNPDKSTLALASKDYGTKNVIVMDYNNSFIKSFSFTSKNIGVPYIMIFNNKSGDCVNAASLLGINYDIDFFKSLTADLSEIKVSKTTETDCYDNNNDGYISPSSILFKVLDEKCYDIGNLEMSKISRFTFTEDLSKIAFLDYENPIISVAEKTSDDYVVTHVIKAEDKEYNLFQANDVPDEIADFIRKLNTLQVIYLDVCFTNNLEELLVSSSLPKLYWEDMATEKLEYMNEPCLIRYNLAKKSKDICQIPMDSMAITTHSKIFIDEQQQRLFMGILKGWPVQGVFDEPPRPEDDPYNDDFYKFCPMLAAHRLPDISFQKYVGEISKWHKEEHCGYFYFYPLVSFDNDVVVVADALVGDVTVLDRITLEQTSRFNLFKMLSDNGMMRGKNQLHCYDLSKSKIQNIIDKDKLRSGEIMDMKYHNGVFYFLVTDDKNIVMYLVPSINSTEDNNKIISTDYITSPNDGNNIKISINGENVSVVVIDDKSDPIKMRVLRYLN